MQEQPKKNAVRKKIQRKFERGKRQKVESARSSKMKGGKARVLLDIYLDGEYSDNHSEDIL